ncbi:MAG TPA: hypothetical protein VE152_03540 [Acidimicrobiales bacterium]|nr:hypothetical protein [Acidimicrobiales bacterium]
MVVGPGAVVVGGVVVGDVDVVVVEPPDVVDPVVAGTAVVEVVEGRLAVDGVVVGDEAVVGDTTARVGDGSPAGRDERGGAGRRVDPWTERPDTARTTTEPRGPT